ncbi:MAG: hypothetical protein QXP01_06150 [Candidatus Hadarchaeum sp.]
MPTVSGDDIVRSLYKSILSCADHHDDKSSVLKGLHIKTAIDAAIIKAVGENKIVIITGNPGDGKTHLIRQVQNKFPKEARVYLDANQRDDEQWIKEMDEAYSSKYPFVLAINQGVLLSICEKAQSPWAKVASQAILRPYIYTDDEEALETDARILVLDLNLRNNLAKDIVKKAIENVVALADLNGTLAENAARLKNPIVVERVAALLDAVGRTGYHATMRDLLGFIAYLMCGGEEELEAKKPRPYYVNAFVGGIGGLFERVREFDPLRLPAPFLDDRLFMCLDDDSEWELRQPSERREKENMDLFKDRKRRAYFEHKDGDRILRIEQSDVDRKFDELKQVDQAPEMVAVRLLNQFFEGSKADPSNLTLWMGHQYWAKPIRFVASCETISARDLAIRIPKLPKHLRDIFPDHYPDHVMLNHCASKDINDGLVIDRSMVAMLLAKDQSTGIGLHHTEVFAKIAAFYDRLARLANKQNIVQILRLDNGEKVRIGVQTERRVYFIPGGG